jgi:putative PIN family toxin of toxin-antitoxin system
MLSEVELIMKVYIDASVMIAALLSPTGGSAKIFNLIRSKKIVGITSQTVVDEVLEHKEKISASLAEIHDFIVKHNLLVRKRLTRKEIELYSGKIDRDDAHLIAGAKLTKCSALVSLDKKHVLQEKVKQAFLPLKILNPKEFLQELRI